MAGTGVSNGVRTMMDLDFTAIGDPADIATAAGNGAAAAPDAMAGVEESSAVACAGMVAGATATNRHSYRDY